MLLQVFANLLGRSLRSLVRGFQEGEHDEREVAFKLFFGLLGRSGPGGRVDSVQGFHSLGGGIGYDLFYFHVSTLFKYMGYKDNER